MKNFWVFILFFLVSFQGRANFVPHYPYHLSDTSIVFPFDEGSHPGAGILEWWYTVMHVKGKTSGHDYAILVTHFSNDYRFFNIIDLTKDKLISGTARGSLVSAVGVLNLSQKTEHGTDTWKTVAPFEYELETHYENMKLNANIKVVKEPLRVNRNGFAAIGSSGFTWYYSFTRMDSIGTLTFDGLTEEFEGIAWFDHQWGPFVISPVEGPRFFETYEWFCIQLDNGAEFMVSNIFDRAYRLNPTNPAYGGIGWSLPDGTQGGTLKRIFTRLGYYQDPKSKNIMSMGWRLEIPELDLDLKMEPVTVNQMVDFPFGGSFWEGAIKVTGTMKGQAVTGKSFGELIHRYHQPKLKVKTILNQKGFKIESSIKNPDDGAHLITEILDQNNNSVISAANYRKASFLLPVDSAKKNLKVVVRSEDRVLYSEKEIERK